MSPILRAKLFFITLLPLCFSCTRYVCPAYLTSFQVSNRAIESFFSYYVLDSLDPTGKLKKTREGFVIFNRPEEFKIYSIWEEDSIGWAGIMNDTSTSTADDFKFKSGSKQSRFAAKKKPADHLFRTYPQTSVLTGAQKLGIISKIFKKRPQNFNRYVKAKMSWAKPAETSEQDSAIITDATVEDLKFQLKKEPKRKSLASSEQIYYDMYVVPMLPNFDSLIYGDTAKVVIDSTETEKPRRWWQFWKKREKVISDYQIEEEDQDDEVLVEGEDFAAPDPPEKKRASLEKKAAKRKGKKAEAEEESETDEETPKEEDEPEPAPVKKKKKAPKKKKDKKSKSDAPPEEEEESGGE